MKILHPLFVTAALLPGLLMNACTKTDPVPAAQADNWTKEEVLKKLDGEWKVMQVRRVVGRDTAVVVLPGFEEYNKSMVLKFISFSTTSSSGADGTIINYKPHSTSVGNSSDQFFSTNFPDIPPGLPMFIVFPKVMDQDIKTEYVWDDTINTVVFIKNSNPTYLPLPLNKKAALDRASFLVYDNFNDAKAAGKPTNITLVAEETDPTLGNVKYLVTLRKLWSVGTWYVGGTSSNYVFALL
jgi:hypothetical protein